MLATDNSTTCAEAILNLKRAAASAQAVETSVTNNSPFQDFSHPDDHFQSRNDEFINISTQCFFYINVYL